MIELLPSFGGLLGTIVAFLVALSIIVAIHEYGHYIVGRWCGIHAEVFSLGFGPVIFSREDRRGTRWQIAALPLGGYVRFMGDANAASAGADGSLEGLDAEARKRTMHGADLWRRAATVAAGPFANFLLSTVVFAAVLMIQGLSVETPIVDRVKALPGAHAFETGDRIIAVGGQSVTDIASFAAAADSLPTTAPVTYLVDRNGSQVAVDGPFPLPPVVDSLQPRAAAIDAGFQVGDVITAIDGSPIVAFRQVQQAVAASDGATLTMTVWRDGSMVDISLAPRRMDVPLADGGFETRWLVGVSGAMFFDPATERPGVIEAVGLGVQQVIAIIQSSLSGLAHIITGAISSCNLSGPIGIAETTGAVASQGLDNYIWFIAVLSTAVGLLNLFPIPVLDGGHLVFHAWEAVAGKPPSDRVLRVFFAVGFAVIMTMMLFALGNDLMCP